MRAPNRLYWLEIVGGKSLPYQKRGGGKFTSKAAAENRQEYLSKYHGVETKLFQTQELVWEEATDG